MLTEKVAIYAAGGFAREVAWLVESCSPGVPPAEVVCFIDDNPALHGTLLNSIPVMGLEEAQRRFPDAYVACAVGSPRVRRRLVDRADARGFRFRTLVHSSVLRSRWIELGTGSIICAGCILTTNIVVGPHVHINLDCTVGHDVSIGAFSTLAPGVHVSGCVVIGEDVSIGTGAVIINGTADNPLRIGDGSVIGAGACVTKSVPAGVTAVGVPAKPLPLRPETRDHPATGSEPRTGPSRPLAAPGGIGVQEPRLAP
jgi:sugar O-acyltransferase (sialic acid O-acetyltransferase NeuD family)